MTTKPKLLLVSDTYYPKTDGIVRFIEEFTKRAKDLFHIVNLVPDFGERRKTGQVIALPISSRFKSSDYATIKLSLKNLRRIREAVLSSDIIFVQGPGPIGILSVYFSKIYRKRCIYYVHLNPWEFFRQFLQSFPTKILYFFLKPFLRLALNSCSLIVVPYQGLVREFSEKGIRCKMEVAKLGVDIDLFSPAENKVLSKKKLGLSEDKKVIGYVGRISKEKNTHLLLKAFKKLPHSQQVFLLMVGDGPEDQTKEFKEIENCRITGFVPNVQEYLKAMDVFVMPSLTETTSLATLEAMAAGLPVIATRVGFIQQYLIKDYNGTFFPRRSSTMLAVKIEKLLANKYMREKFGQHARKTVAYSFSWERSINKIKKIILVQLSS